MSKRDLSKKSYQRAVDYARKNPSRISEVQVVLSNMRQKFGQLEFEVQGALYDLLLSTQNKAEQGEIFHAYLRGLVDVEQEGRLRLEQVWRVSFDGERLLHAFIDGGHGQVVATTYPGLEERSSRKGGVYGLRIADGGQVWSYHMKKNWAPWQPCLGQHYLFFIGSYTGDRDSFVDHPIYALSLTSGDLAWKGSSGKNADAQQVRGLFGDFLLANISDDQGNGLVAIDAGTGMESWRYPSYCRVSGKLFLPLEDVLCAQYRDREIGWFSQGGKLRKKITLRFPKRDEGFIDLAYADGDTIYVCVWDSWHDWGEDDHVKASETATVVYAIGTDDRKVKWSLRPKVTVVRFTSILSHGKKLYLCSENVTIVVDKESGEIVKEWPFQVLHVFGRLFFRSDRKDSFSSDPFAFYACSVGTGKVRWQRENFDLLAAKNGLLVGRVGDTLVVLDEKTGKEKVSVGSHEPREVQFVTKESFLVTSRRSLRLFKLGGEV